MDELVLDKMKLYVAITQKNTEAQERKIQELTDELEACRSIIESLQLDERDRVKGVSQFVLEQLKSGGEIVEQTKHQVDKGLNVMLEKSDGFHSVYRVLLSNCDPCPSPTIVDGAAGPAVAVDPAQTMCDIWEGLDKMEKVNNRSERTQAMDRRKHVRNSVCTAFGCREVGQDTTLFRAACGFVEGSQEICQGCVADETGIVAVRCTKKQRKELLMQMITYMYNGEVVQDLEKKVLRRKRFSTVKLARTSDMNSSFNASALGAIASCEGGKAHGEIGVLCGESTLRRCLKQVHTLAVDLGFYSMPELEQGKVWCWGDENGAFKTALNHYVKTIYYDACCDSVTANEPWILPLTGDGVRTSTRGRFVTVVGPKMSDHRLVNQERSGKTMFQGSDMYTPAAAGYVDENGLMEFFHLLVKECLKIEEQQFCVVNDKKYTVYIKVAVIADLAFLHKYVQRGGGSHSTTCFCLFCGALRNFRHHGYPGGCRKCRRLGIVYDKDGVQQCTHYEACTEEFLHWQSERYAELSLLVPEFPLTSLPAWEDVKQLRKECLKRCIGPWSGWRARIEKRGKGMMTGQALSDWILKYTRDDATLSSSKATGVMLCPMKIVLASLVSRKIKVPERATGAIGLRLRLQLRALLQLEQEYTRMTMHMRDTRFSSTHVSAKAVPLERLILCVLHCPMRTHEKVLTMLFQKACEHRMPNKSKEILDEMVVIIRRLGKLQDTWTYVWEKGAQCVSKVKLHWDQSKRIFMEENMDDLRSLIQLAVHPTEQSYWVAFVVQYIKCIDLLTVTRDYSTEDIDQLEVYCNATFTLLVTHCGGQSAVTNYFHYIGSGHVVWMCRAYGNIWRFRNEGVEAFNKTLSKRSNMFNSHGNRGNVADSGTVEPFEVLGTWMSRYAMWQLELANQLFVAKGGKLGKSELKYDDQQDMWDYVSDVEDDADDGDYSVSSASSETDSDSDIEDFAAEDALQCVYNAADDVDYTRYCMRKRKQNNELCPFIDPV
jgi:hypothetical protein